MHNKLLDFKLQILYPVSYNIFQHLVASSTFSFQLNLKISLLNVKLKDTRLAKEYIQTRETQINKD